MGIFKSKDAVAEVVSIEIALLVPNKSQPRREFSGEALKSLSESIRENGIIQPICVRRMGALYEIISGERRCRAAKLAGLTQVPCIVMEVGDEQAAVLALIENIQRKDLSYFEEAAAIEKLIKVYGLTQEEAAVRLGKAQSTIANKLRLLRFTDAERRILLTGSLSERQARAIVRIADDETRRAVIDRVVRARLNLDQTEALVEQTLAEIDKPAPRKKPTFIISPHSRLYINSLNALLKRIKSDNIPCEMSTEKSDDYFEYTIRFPFEQKQKAGADLISKKS